MITDFIFGKLMRKFIIPFGIIFFLVWWCNRPSSSKRADNMDWKAIAKELQRDTSYGADMLQDSFDILAKEFAERNSGQFVNFLKNK